MSAHPQPSAFEARTNATYTALMWALSRPGLARDMPVSGFQPIIEALIDRECAVCCDDPEHAAFAGRTGAALVGMQQADHVFLTAPTQTDILRTLRCGSDLHPEDGATLVLTGCIEDGPRLRLTGPGVDGAIDIQLAGLPDGFWTLRDQLARYPMGFEMFVVDGARVLGIPRSTRVEVL